MMEFTEGGTPPKGIGTYLVVAKLGDEMITSDAFFNIDGVWCVDQYQGNGEWKTFRADVIFWSELPDTST
jgi:hypothetical protein